MIKVSPRVARKSQALDDKGASAFGAESSDLAANIDALIMAVAVLEKGVAGSSFLQSRVGSAIRKVATSSEKVSDSDLSTLLSFLSIGDRQGYAPKSGEIIGILKQLKDEMSERSCRRPEGGRGPQGQPCGTHSSEEEGNCHFDINDPDEIDLTG